VIRFNLWRSADCAKMEPAENGTYVFWWEVMKEIDRLKDLARRQDKEIQRLREQQENLPHGQ